MIIKEIEINHLSVKLKNPYRLSDLYGTLYTTEPVVVKIITDEGIFGYGETDPLALFTGETPETVVAVLEKYIAPALIGKNPLNIAGIHKIMDSVIKDMHLAKAAIDIAIYDIIGKYTGLSVSDFLGGRQHNMLPQMGSVGGGTPEDTVNYVKKSIDDVGYKSFMIKVGNGDVDLDIKRTIAVREALGKDYPLIADANQGWDVAQTLKYLKGVESCDLVLLEQPVAAWDIDGLKKIKESTNILISADESLLSFENAKILIKERAVDVFSIKVSKNGGIYRAKEIADLAKAFGIKCLFNSMIEEGITQAASFALGATVENLYEHGHAYFSPLRLEDDITNFSSYIKDGYITVPNNKGLGIEVDEEKIKKYCINKITIN